jgi:hypothetical protein
MFFGRIWLDWAGLGLPGGERLNERRRGAGVPIDIRLPIGTRLWTWRRGNLGSFFGEQNGRLALLLS